MKRDKLIKMVVVPYMDETGFEGAKGDWCSKPFLCRDGGLNDYFAIPKSVKTIYIRLSKKPSKEAYKIEFEERSEATLIHTKDKIWKRGLTYSTDKVMKAYGFPFYASVEY